MSTQNILLAISIYFIILFLVSKISSYKTNKNSFYTGDRKSPWFIVAFGMIGASLSGVTFISLPGEVGKTSFLYFQMVLGYIAGYFVIYTILLPIFYKLKLISIYRYLENRLGRNSYKTASIFFMLSQLVGASFRFTLVVGVLQTAICDHYNIPFELTCFITILITFLYTFRSGIKTIVWTDAIQTFFMLTAVSLSIYLIMENMGLNFSSLVSEVYNSEYSKMFDFDWSSKTFFFKHFFSGMFICIVMTGIDQNMMQKNLTCKTLRASQKNMFSLSILLVPVNILFLTLGALLFIYANKNGIAIPDKTDYLYSEIALNHFSGITAIVFIIGIISAGFSSIDSSLTAMTTSFSIDFLKLNRSEASDTTTRRMWVQLSFALAIFLIITTFHKANDDSVLNMIFKAAGYTYGPILGMFAFGIFTNKNVLDQYVPYIAIISPLVSYFISLYSKTLLFGYEVGFEIVIINGLISFILLLLFSQKPKQLNHFEEHQYVWKMRNDTDL
jgi:Na+/proline symporter